MCRLLCFALFSLVAACGRGEPGPNLIELTELGPRHLEVGDRVRLTGSGFPEGRPARVTLHGEIRRAGELANEGISLSSDAQLVAPHAVEFPITTALAAQLCGTADARHVTFRGDVELAFAPRKSSGSEVGGRLDGIVIDLMPDKTDEHATVALERDGARFAEFVGAKVNVSPDGLTLSAVEPKSRAARAGLAPGDLVLELDGVVVRETSDFIPPPNAKSSTVLFRRGPEQLSVRLDASGFRYSAPETLLPALTAILSLVLVFAFLYSPLGQALGFLSKRLCERLRQGRHATPAGAPARSLAQTSLWVLVEQLPTSFWPYLALVGASAALSLVSLGRSVVASELDLLIVPFGSTAGLLMAALVSARLRGKWSALLGLERTLALFLANIPLSGLVLTAACWAGSARLADIVSQQGPWPWQWAAFNSPVIGTLTLLVVLGLIPRARPVSLLSQTGTVRLVAFAEWVHALAATGLLALVALGGYRSPFGGGSTGALLFGVVLVLLKSWGLLAFLALLRWLVGPIDVLTVRKTLISGLVLPSALALSAAASSRYWLSTGPVLGTLTNAVGPALFAATVVVLGWTGYRVLQLLRFPGEGAGIQPWL